MAVPPRFEQFVEQMRLHGCYGQTEAFVAAAVAAVATAEDATAPWMEEMRRE